MSENSGASGGIGFWGLLQIAFIVLKLTGVIGWSWVAVLLPTIILAGIVIVAIVVMLALRK